jgi:hypothetical protein
MGLWSVEEATDKPEAILDRDVTPEGEIPEPEPEKPATKADRIKSRVKPKVPEEPSEDDVLTPPQDMEAENDENSSPVDNSDEESEESTGELFI